MTDQQNPSDLGRAHLGMFSQATDVLLQESGAQPAMTVGVQNSNSMKAYAGTIRIMMVHGFGRKGFTVR